MSHKRANLDVLKGAPKKVMKGLFSYYGEHLCPPGMPKEEATRAFEELWSLGWIRIGFNPKRDRFEIEPCFPEEAPQLKGPLAVEQTER